MCIKINVERQILHKVGGSKQAHIRLSHTKKYFLHMQTASVPARLAWSVWMALIRSQVGCSMSTMNLTCFQKPSSRT